MPAIVCSELLLGAHLAGSGPRAAQRRSKIEALLGRVPLIPFDQPVAELDYGVLVGMRDEAHFRCVPGRRVETLSGRG